MTFLLPYTPMPMRKNSFRIPFSEGREIILAELPPLKVYQSRLTGFYGLFLFGFYNVLRNCQDKNGRKSLFSSRGLYINIFTEQPSCLYTYCASNDTDKTSKDYYYLACNSLSGQGTTDHCFYVMLIKLLDPKTAVYQFLTEYHKSDTFIQNC